MTHSESQSGLDLPVGEVLTLPEVAAYLRVSEEAVQELIAKDVLPAQRIGTEWRVLKHAVVEWLRFGPRFRELRMYPPPWMLDHPLWADLVRTLEQRILSKVSAPEHVAKPGSKRAVLRHFGIFKADGDAEEQVAKLRARREAAGE